MKLYGPVLLNSGSSGNGLCAVLKGYGFTPILFEAMHLLNKSASVLASHIKVLRSLPVDYDAIWICEDTCELGLQKEVLLSAVTKFLSLGDVDGLFLTHKDLKSIDYDADFKQILGSSLANCYIVKRGLVDELIKIYGASYRSIITEQPNVYLSEYRRLDLPQRNVDMNSVERSLHVVMNKSCWLKTIV